MKIGIDIGGNHIGIGIIENDKIVQKKETDITKKDRENIEKNLINKITTCIKSFNDVNNIDKIGICSCGTVGEGKIIKATNLKLFDYPIVDLLKKEYPNSNITIKNDAKCAAIAEKMYGSLKNYENAVFLTIGTGIGGACFINGKLLEPKKYPGFEIGHTVIKVGGRDCSCGQKGCFETYASIEALKKKVKNTYNIKEEITGKQLLDIIIKEKDEKMKQLIEEYTEYLSIGISNIINLFEPEVICIGGSFVYYKEIILEKVQEKLYLFNQDQKPNIIIAKLQNDAGIIGAVNN